MIGWAGTLAAAHLVTYGFGHPRLLMVLESLAYQALFVALFSFEPVGIWIRRIPSPHRTVLVIFIACVTWGQLVVDSRTTFPFTAWTMYARPESRKAVDYFRYRGVDAQGREVAVDPAEEFTFVNSAEIASRVREIGRYAINATDVGKRANARERMHDLLVAMAAAHNRTHPQAPLRSLEMMHYSWDFRAGPATDVVPTSVIRIDVPESGP
jgi:hypothetical protein